MSKMFDKVLVANRGEIAVRIIRALREMGITSVAVYSEADKDALHTQLADEAIAIGPARGLDSYQNPVAILSAALVSGAQAIHPGYGFLSERSDFISMCEDVGIKFIGPSSEVVEAMGNKQNARETMIKAGVTVTPGSEDFVYTLEEAQEVAKMTGYPLMVKAADGGGGTGMRSVETADDLEAMFFQAQAESQAVYGNKNLYMERIIYPARHIEVQILGDSHGNVIHLGERDCSIQHNHQKIFEVAPAQSLSQETKEKLYKEAVKAASEVGYENAGTIEFLVDSEENFYFMEMNTRLQVEHPLTEMVTGIDLVKEQIKIAAGMPLEIKQEDVTFDGIAIEVRLTAENPYENFRPSAGHIERLILPTGGLGLRVESAVYPYYTLPPYYDSMIGKIIVHRPTRQEAFTLLDRALVELVVDGIDTNIDILEALTRNKDVQEDNYHTRWFEETFMPEWLEESNDH